MILLDVNILVRAHMEDAKAGTGARAWLERALSDDEPVAVWDSILVSAFRVLTLPKLIRGDSTPTLVMEFLQQVRDASVVVGVGDRHWRLTCDLIKAAHATGNLVMDAAIAAVAIENGCRLATFDKDFARFPGLQWFMPPIG